MAGRTPNMASALEAAIHPKWQGKGVSKLVIQAMRDIARAHGLAALVAPVRPSEKAKWPHTPIGRYVKWVNDKDEPFDAWIAALAARRAHRQGRAALDVDSGSRGGMGIMDGDEVSRRRGVCRAGRAGADQD